MVEGHDQDNDSTGLESYEALIAGDTAAPVILLRGADEIVAGLENLEQLAERYGCPVNSDSGLDSEDMTSREKTSWAECFRLWFFRGSRKVPIPSEVMVARPVRDSAGRIFALFLLVIPAKRRDEIIGDFHESLAKARQDGYGRIALFFLAAGKILLYAWVCLKFRASDFARSEEEHEQPETPE